MLSRVTDVAEGNAIRERIVVKQKDLTVQGKIKVSRIIGPYYKNRMSGAILGLFEDRVISLFGIRDFTMEMVT
jgi:hypothetical protein